MFREVGYRGLQKIRRRQEVGVEDGNEFALGREEALGQGARLVTPSMAAPDVSDVMAGRPESGHQIGRERGGFVGRIVQDLDFVAIVGIIERANGQQKPLHHVLLVEDGQLGGDHGQGTISRLGGGPDTVVRRSCGPAMPEHHHDQDIGVQAVEKQADRRGHVDDQSQLQKQFSEHVSFSSLDRCADSSSRAPGPVDQFPELGRKDVFQNPLTGAERTQDRAAHFA